MYAPLVTPTGFREPVQTALPQAVKRIVEILNPQKIVLFGSYANGFPTPDSDVDLLIVMETSASQVERYRNVSDLLYPRQFPVDILVKTPREIDKALQKGDFFIKEIFQEGIVLYEQS
jgi:predicted nucleotidyltransferase